MVYLFGFVFAFSIFAQWEPDVRLTNDVAASWVCRNSGRCIAANGTSIHIVWYDLRDGNREIYYKRSTNNGASWSADIRLTNDPAASYYPSVAVSDSNIHVVWYDLRDGNREIYYKRSTDNGTTWGSDMRLTNDDSSSYYPSVAVSGSNVHVVWYDLRDGNREIYYKRSTDNGTTWGSDTRLTNNTASSYYPSVAVWGSNVHVVWYDRRDGNDEIYYKRSTNNGTAWGSDTRLTNNGAESNDPTIAVSGSNVHIVWADNRDGNYEIYYKRSTNNGTAWGGDTRLTNDTAQSQFPSIVASDTTPRNLHIVWKDSSGANLGEIYYKRSTNNGDTWSVSTRLTNNPAESHFPSVALTNLYCHVAWRDNRDGNDEIYYKRNYIGVAVNDVGTVAIVAPKGTIDSGVVVTPACTVQNFGTTTPTSYLVRMKIGAFYNDTARVNNHAPGTKVYLTFPAWAANQKGVHTVSCSTELTGDAVPANDKKTDSVEVVRLAIDVGCIKILAPIGVVDSGVVLTPACTVYNYGDSVSSYPVRMKIGNFYNNTASVTNHTPGTKVYLTFSPWTANSPRGTYPVSCSTELSGDLRAANDKKSDSVTVRVGDVGTVAIVAPTGTIDSGTVVTPACTLYNFGSVSETYPVRFKIGTFYNDTAIVTNHTPGTKVYLTFSPWTVNSPRGTYPVSCSTELTGDMQSANDKRVDSVTVRISDVGTVAIVAPIGTVDSGTVVTPACTLYNFGSVSETYPVRFKIGTFYNDTARVINHLPGTKVYLTFSAWTATQRGPHTVSCSTELTGDMQSANDKKTDSVTVRVNDVGTVVIVAPTGVVDSGTVVTPACTVYNYGTTTPTSYTVRMKIGNFYNSNATVTNHAPGSAVYVTFPVWMVYNPRGSYPVSCSTELTGDMRPTNDKRQDSVRIQVGDVGCTKIVAPTGQIDSGVNVFPACSVYNYGTSTPTYRVRMKIGTFYDDTVRVTGHSPGTFVYLSFPAYAAWPRGTHIVSCSTELAGDMQSANDKRTDSVKVRNRDVGVLVIVAPGAMVDSGASVVPGCTVYNYGTTTESYNVRMKISTFYNSNGSAINHAPQTKLYITFPIWYPHSPRGNYPVSCSTELTGDMVPGNDKRADSLLIRVLDVGAIDITAPGDSVKKDSIFTPKARARNYGNTTVTLPTHFAIIRGVDTAYRKTVNITISPDSIKEVSFRDTAFSLTAWYQMRFWTELSGDMHPANNLVRDSFKVYQPGQAIGDLEKLVMVNRPGLVIKSNPTRLLTTVYYSLPAKEVASLVIYNVLGEVVYSAKTDKGFFTIKRLPAGTYLLRFTAKGYKEERKLIIVK